MLLVDTNIIAYFFNGDINAGNLIAQNEIAISAITYTEILSNKNLNKEQRLLVHDFLNTIFICHTNAEITETAISYCLSYNIKPMDAIILATAKFLNTSIATADKKLFKIKEVTILKLNP
ncbi:MAG: PIN domain-containing protein [Bacteroidetes bacterium]|nr:PIN domain-containing protein [Bacteroidota bacterium]MBS1590498.1 PIN domain-containing protein [Bacteroidota bacterium]